MSADLENLLQRKIHATLLQHNTDALVESLTQVARSLQIDPLQAAAAILYMDMADITQLQALLPPTRPLSLVTEQKPERLKMVRYRLEVGRAHEVSTDDIKTVLINESGVERAKIGYLDIRSHYTLIDLPNGMPPDIFQHLQSVEIKQHPLKIKRVGSPKKRQWQRQRRKPNDASAMQSSKSD